MDSFSWLLSGKSLKELNFPQDWKYDPTMCGWYSDKHTCVETFIGASYPTTKKKGDKIRHYIYITDKMLLSCLKGE